MDARDYRIREMAEADIAAAHGLSQAVGWPHRAEDWRLLHRIGHGIVAAEGDGRVVGTGLWWPYGPAAGSLGMVIVAGDRQGAGIGRRLMDTILAAAGGRSMLLNATAAGLPLYEKLGFAALGRVGQHQGVRGAVPPVPEGAGTVRPLRPDEAGLPVALDDRAMGAPRHALMAALLAAGEAAVVEREGRVVGCALARRFGRGHLVGPVMAADAPAAKALIAYFLGRADGFWRLDLSDAAGELAAWASEAGLVSVGGGVVMVRGTPLAPDPVIRHWTIAAQALG